MAEETIENQGTEELQSTEAQAETVDWEAKYKELQKESRKWESRAKANKSAADELSKAKEANKSVEERIAALESENQSYKAQAARTALIADVAKETGLPTDIVSLLNGEDEEALVSQAKLIAEQMKKKGGAPFAEEAGRKQKPGKMTKEEILKQKHITGKLSEEAYTEGDDIPVSTYLDCQSIRCCSRTQEADASSTAGRTSLEKKGGGTAG